jgi:hypothetical protein
MVTLPWMVELQRMAGAIPSALLEQKIRPQEQFHKLGRKFVTNPPFLRKLLNTKTLQTTQTSDKHRLQGNY